MSDHSLLKNTLKKLNEQIGDSLAPLFSDTVIVDLSGGVDSSVCAFLLKELGYDVRGLHMVCWKSSDSWCRADQDLRDAISVSSHLNIPLEAVDYTKEYKEKVFDYMINFYKMGITPNPDVVCNKEIKFGLGLDYTNKLDCKYFSTGHYASLKKTESLKLKEPSLKKLLDEKINSLIGTHQDKNKDQSYFLSSIIKSPYLDKVIYPLSVIKDKNDVRSIAKIAGIKVSEKPDSQGLCFVGDVKMSEFLSKYIKKEKGEVINLKQEVIGRHFGLHLYTIGQRHGFDIYKYSDEPLYVIKKDPSKNMLMVGKREDCFSKSFCIKNLESVFTSNEYFSYPELSGKITVRIRSTGESYEISKIQKIKDDIFEISSKQPIFAVAPGQIAVFYCADSIIATGEIL